MRFLLILLVLGPRAQAAGNLQHFLNDLMQKRKGNEEIVSLSSGGFPLHQ
jgi:hypothetical protein